MHSAVLRITKDGKRLRGDDLIGLKVSGLSSCEIFFHDKQLKFEPESTSGVKYRARWDFGNVMFIGFLADELAIPILNKICEYDSQLG